MMNRKPMARRATGFNVAKGLKGIADAMLHEGDSVTERSSRVPPMQGVCETSQKSPPSRA